MKVLQCQNPKKKHLNKALVLLNFFNAICIDRGLLEHVFVNNFFSLFLSISRIFFGFGSGDALAVDILDFLVSNRLSLVSHLLWICIH